MPKLIAISEVRYAAVNLKPGDPFEATENDAMILKAIGKAKDDDDKKVRGKSLKAEEPVAKPSAVPAADDKAGLFEDQPAERRHYRRRDMTAAED